MTPTNARPSIPSPTRPTSLTCLNPETGLRPANMQNRLQITYVTHLVEFGYPERFVTDQVGHLWGSTTAIYTSVSNDFKNKTLQAALARVYQPGGEGGTR